MEPSTCVEAEPFALMVKDDSMEPEFSQGCIIIVDPTGHAADGAFVLAEVDGTYTFRQLREKDNALALVPLNVAYPVLPIPSITPIIKGVVTQRAGTRRDYYKRYG